jgi:hypothetical protein
MMLLSLGVSDCASRTWRNPQRMFRHVKWDQRFRGGALSYDDGPAN